jgi:ATP-independent RNA helicase DbpA
MGSVGRIEQLQKQESVWHALEELKPTGSGPLLAPMVTLHIQGGRKEKIRPGDVLGALTADLGYTREQVGKINVNEWSTYIAVNRDIGEQVAQRLSRIKGKNVKARLLED